jgi:uncharacterized phage-associated protein
MPTVHDVADYLLWLADRDRIGVDHLKLQKLVYYAQAFHLGSTGEPLFEEELRAWQYGPVCLELWERYRYRRDYLQPPESPSEGVFSDDAREVVTMVYQRFRELSGIELFRRTHEEDPWIDADRRARTRESDLISIDALRDYFAGKLWVLIENQEAPPPVSATTVARYLEAHPELIAEAKEGTQDLARRA